MTELRDRHRRRALLGSGVGIVSAGVLASFIALSATAQAPPKGMSTKQPGDAPPQTLEELREKGILGVPDPDEKVKDPGENYPDPVELSKGSLQPPTIPQTPQILRYRVDRPLRYVVRGTNRMAVKDREDLKQIYRTSNVVRYEPIEDAQVPASRWHNEDQEQVDKIPLQAGERRVMMEVEKSFGEFLQPDLLGQTERTHQVMRQARVSYRMTEQGQISDVRVHSPTHPLAKSSLSQVAHLSGTMQPALPERAVGPGDTWEQAIIYRDAEGLAQMSEDSVNRYTFERWRPCRDSLCAYITIKQEMKAAARMKWRDQETKGASVGYGSGWILFDYQRGEIVKSFWKLTGQGFVRAYADSKISDDQKELAGAEVLVELEVTTERVDTTDAMPPRKPTRDIPANASQPTDESPE